MSTEIAMIALIAIGSGLVMILAHIIGDK